MNVIYILWLRQIKKYLRSRSRIIGSIGQPLLYLIALGFGFGPIFEKAGGGNYIDFLAPGIISMSILFSSVFVGIEVIWDKQFGFLKETLVAPVSRYEIMLGRTIGGATIAVIQGSLVFIISLLLGFSPNLTQIPVAIVFAFLIALTFTAIGTAIASVLDDMQGFQLIMNFLVMPTFFLSGSIFPLTNLPDFIFFLTRIDPLTYGVDGLRGALIGASHMGMFYDFLILLTMMGLIMSIGSYLFSKIQI